MQRLRFWRTVVKALLFLAVQVFVSGSLDRYTSRLWQFVLAIPFLRENPWGYLQRSFNFGEQRSMDGL